MLSGAGLSSWHRNAGASLSIAPAAAMAAGLASWWITAWWENVDRDARKWTAFGLALRMVVLAFLLFAPLAAAWMMLRSEEHTSELQSLMRISYAVFCLKKKKHTNIREQG